MLPSAEASHWRSLPFPQGRTPPELTLLSKPLMVPICMRCEDWCFRYCRPLIGRAGICSSEFLHTGLVRHQICFLDSELEVCLPPFAFQIGACGYIGALVRNSCWLIQAFSLACTVKGYKMRKYEGTLGRRNVEKGEQLCGSGLKPQGKRTED